VPSCGNGEAQTTNGDASDKPGPEKVALGPNGGNPKGEADAVEAALGEALRGATAAGQWTLVATLAKELQARREARAGVIDLDAVRRGRKGGGQ